MKTIGSYECLSAGEVATLLDWTPHELRSRTSIYSAFPWFEDSGKMFVTWDELLTYAREKRKPIGEASRYRLPDDLFTVM